MATKAKLKFRGDMPWDLEHKLVTKHGFRIYSRHGREWIIVEKLKSPFQAEVLVNGELPEDIRNTLLKRCNTIVDQFVDPDAYAYVVRTRLLNMSRTLPPLQKKFVEQWVQDNIEADE